MDSFKHEQALRENCRQLLKNYKHSHENFAEVEEAFKMLHDVAAINGTPPTSEAESAAVSFSSQDNFH